MKDKKKLDLISERIKSPDFSGAILVCDHNEVIIEDCNGYADRANKRKINIDTRLAIASGTKMFTALGIMKLIELDRLKLDDKVFDIVPRSFPTYDKSVTIKHLLTHSSGIPDYYDEELMEAGVDIKLSIPNYDLNKPSDYLEIMPDKKMKFAPGKAFNYNNSAFVLLAVIIELLTGDYHLWIEKEVLQKARMISSGFFKMDQLPTNTAIGYLETDKSSNKSNIYQLPIIGGGDGGMYTTVKDMDRFWDAFLEGEIVNSNIVKEMITPHSHSSNLSYGLGVWLESNGESFDPILFGQDPGVSFVSGFQMLSNKKHTVISNTEKGAWGLSNLLKDL